MAPTWLPEVATSPQDGPKMAQDGSRQPQDGPKTAQETPKTAQERSKRAPRRLQSDPREPKTGKDGSKTVEGPKTVKEALQGTLKKAREAKIIEQHMVFV